MDTVFRLFRGDDAMESNGKAEKFVFISHSSMDKNEVNRLSGALKSVFSGKINTFNTSSGLGIVPGEKWREAVVKSMKISDVVILWCTPSAKISVEVAFEIGVAHAFGKHIIPCAVHLSPSEIPWDLSSIHALSLADTENVWRSFVSALADTLKVKDVIDVSPLLGLSQKFKSSDRALSVNGLGLTVEFKNISEAKIFDIEVVSKEGDSPPWSEGINGYSLDPGGRKIIMREFGVGVHGIVVRWKDRAGVSHSQFAEI